jgi:hypothetical protein
VAKHIVISTPNPDYYDPSPLSLSALMRQKNFNLPALCTIECFHPNAGEFGRKPEVTWLRYCCEPQCRKLIGELRKDTHPNGVATWYEHVVDWDTEVSIATETYRPCEEVMTKEMFDTWSWPRPDVCILSPTVVRPVAMFSPPVVDWFLDARFVRMKLFSIPTFILSSPILSIRSAVQTLSECCLYQELQGLRWSGG